MNKKPWNEIIPTKTERRKDFIRFIEEGIREGKPKKRIITECFYKFKYNYCYIQKELLRLYPEWCEERRKDKCCPTGVGESELRVKYILSTLKNGKFNIAKAARLIGVTKPSLFEWVVKRWGKDYQDRLMEIYINRRVK